MRIPKFWARASRDGFEAPGWSFTSVADAMRVAEEKVGLLVDHFVNGQDHAGKYLYGDRPVREPIVEELGPEALVTRNAYGALCLNTQDVAFVDVDAADLPLLSKLAAKVTSTDIKDATLDRIRKAHTSFPSWALRIYRTAAGFRVVATHARIAPTSPQANELFAALGADRLYRTLCVQHESFRARLTPKPWRVGLRRMPGVFPWRDEGVEARVHEWIGEYESASAGSAVCELVETLGSESLDPVIARVLAFHDERTLAPGKPLA